VIQRLASFFPMVETIDDQAVAAWIRTLRKAGRAPKTIANYHGLLYAICAYAVRKGLLVHTRAWTPSCRSGPAATPRANRRCASWNRRNSR
jgi:hypothetical protein